jgi:hypothetical protein
MRVTKRPAPYVDYYLSQVKNQTGGNMPYFVGARYQRGHGLGAIFSRLRGAIPWFLRQVGSHALKTGVKVARDVVAGKKMKDVVGPRLLEGAKSFAEDVGPHVAAGIKRSAAKLFDQSKRTRSSDIFD